MFKKNDHAQRTITGQGMVIMVVLLLAGRCCGQSDKYAAIRLRMVADMIEAEGISDPLVLKAMRRVHRHEFVKGALRHRAYEDTALAIGSKQTISPPYIVAYMTETIAPKPTDRVLEIGTGSGYQAAVLAEIVKDVYSVEIVAALSKSASTRLKKLGYDNIHCRHGDGYLGWEEYAPFDKVIVTCSPESIPQPLVGQLKEGGLMIIPVGERYQQSFYLLQKTDGRLVQKKLVPTLFVPMTGTSEDMRRILPDGRNPQVVNGDFEIDGNKDGRVDAWHYQRKSEMWTESPMHGRVCLRFTNQERGDLAQALQGCAIDGRTIGALNCAVWVRLDSVIPGLTKDDSAGVAIHFYDSVRREAGFQVVARWRGTDNWQEVRRQIAVPPNARELVIRLGLNGSTGTLDVDNFRMAGVPR